MLHFNTLSSLSVIEVSGENMNDFLQSQLTQDVNLLTSKNAALAAYCNAKGRVHTSMILSRSESSSHDSIRLIVPDCLLDAFLKKIRMFVLRAKVSFQVSTHRVYGLTLDSQANIPLLNHLHTQLPSIVWEQTDYFGTWIKVPSSKGQERFLYLSDETEINNLPTELTELLTHDEAAWQSGDVLAGLPWLDTVTTETLIPQSLNLDRLGGVSFTKGCYPGQEIVARSHYLGKLKRRLYAIQSDDKLEAHEDIFSITNPESPCGRIITMSFYQEKYYALIECHIEAITDPLMTSNQTSLEVLELPYSLVDD